MGSLQHQSILAEAIRNKWTVQMVFEKLTADGHDQVSADLLIREYKKMLNAARQNKGFLLMAIGAVLGFASCMLTILNVFPDNMSVVLYGLTTVAISIALWGLYYVFE